MSDTSTKAEDSPEEQRFAAAIEEYYQRQASGDFERGAFLQAYADIRAQLEEFLATVAEIGGYADTLAPTAPYRPTQLTTLRYIGDYELLAEIARGGMGVVYRARQVTLNRIVAVKMILAGRLASEDDVERFRIEAKAAARLNHPNIVTIFEIGQHEDQHFFSMEYVEGTTLAKLVRDNPISAQRAAEYVRTIAEAMATTHAANVLHRDLKPSNVLIEAKTGLLRISDFGLAKSTDTASIFTTTGKVLGTPSYMAPEQASGQTELIGPGCDIYAMGAILYELVTGRPPYVGETPWDTAWQVQNTEAVTPTSLNPKVPRDLETICLKCLQKDISRRYPTSQDLADDLGRFLRGEPIRARPVSRAERVWRWCRRNPALASAMGLAALGFLALFITLGVFGETQRRSANTLAGALNTSESRRREANLRLAETERDKGLRLCEQGDIDQGCLWLVKALETAPDDAADLRWSIRINLAAWQRELCVLAAILPDESRQLRFSSDSRRLLAVGKESARIREAPDWRIVSDVVTPGFAMDAAFGEQGDAFMLQVDQFAHVWEQQGDQFKQLTEKPLRRKMQQFVANNRPVIATTEGERKLIFRDAISGEPIGKPLPWNIYEDGAPAISPDGKLALTHTSRTRGILSNLDTGDAIGEPLLHADRVWAAAFSPDSKLLVTGSKKVEKRDELVMAQIWDATTAERIGDPLLHPNEAGDIKHIFFSHDGERLFTATYYKLRLWDRQGKSLGEPIPMSPPQYGQIHSSTDGRLLALFGASGEGRLYDTDTQATVGQPLGLAQQVALTRDGIFAAASDAAGTRLWRTPTRGVLGPVFMHPAKDFRTPWPIFSESGQRLVSVGSSYVRVWDIKTGRPLGNEIKPPESIQCCAFSPDGKLVVTGAMDKRFESSRAIRFWNAETGEEIKHPAPEYKYRTNALAFTPDGQRIVASGDEGEYFVYDLVQRQVVAGPWKQPAIDGDASFRMKISPDGRIAATVSYATQSLGLHDLQSGKLIDSVAIKNESREDFAFSPDGTTLVTVGDRGVFWDLATFSPKPLVLEFKSGASSAAFSADGLRLATTHADRTACLWDVQTGKQIGLPLEHQQTPRQVAFMAADKLLLTGTAEGAYLWEPISGTRVGPSLRPTAIVAASADGRTIATTKGREVRLWQVPAPAGDDAASLRTEVEAATGSTLGESRALQRLSASEWQERQQGLPKQP